MASKQNREFSASIDTLLDYTRECLALEVDTSFASRRVTRVLDEIIEHAGILRAAARESFPHASSAEAYPAGYA